MKEITTGELAMHRDVRGQCVDVRSATEYAAGHVPGAINIPLDQLEARLDDVHANSPIVLICQSGTRARLAAGLLEQCRQDVTVLEGGTSAWAKAGLPLVVHVRTRWSLERQVRLAAGLLVILGTALGVTLHPFWLGLSGFVGLGLTFAGLTDLCPMGVLLGKMPWNRARQCKAPQAHAAISGSPVPGVAARPATVPASARASVCEVGHRQ